MKFKTLFTDLSPLLAGVAIALSVLTFGGCAATTDGFEPGQKVTAEQLDAQIAIQEAEIVGSLKSAQRLYASTVQAAETQLAEAFDTADLDKEKLASLADAKYSDIDRQLALQQKVLGILEPIAKSAAATQGVPPGTTDALWAIGIGAIGIGGTGSAGLMAYRKRRSDQALDQVVAGVQSLRTASVVAEKVEIDAALRQFQTPTTEAMVKKSKATQTS